MVCRELDTTRKHKEQMCQVIRKRVREIISAVIPNVGHIPHRGAI